MQSITDIIFNNIIYSQYDHWIVLLYQINSPSIFIPLPNAHLMTFINVFNDIIGCQNHIAMNNNKNYTLFVDDENIRTWLLNHHAIPDNLNEINIFCSTSNDQKYLARWIRRFDHRIRSIIIYDELDREILIFAMKFIKELCLYFEDDDGILNLLQQEHERIRLALIGSLSQEVNKQDNFIKSSVETT